MEDLTFEATSPLQALNYLKLARHHPEQNSQLIDAALDYLEPYFEESLALSSADKARIREILFGLAVQGEAE
ncbi:hypothetical protein [Acidovorax sp.]|uniref:hypothetical protein n=1 Tax=Acidovorax sp. TaxID=1872122 RepID=UPI00391F28F4